MKPALLLDDDTLALWPCDDAGGHINGYSSVADSGPNEFVIPAASAATTAWIVGGKTVPTYDAEGNRNEPADYARWFDGSNDRFVRSGGIGETDGNALHAEGTAEAWIYLESLPGSLGRWIVAADIIGTTAATRSPFALAVESSGRLRLFWKSGSGTAREALSTGTVPTGQWVHVAATWESSGGTRTVAFFIDGVSAGTDSDTAGSDGRDAQIVIGATQAGTQYWHGKIGAIHVQLAQVPAEAIAQHAASPASLFEATADTWLLVNFDEIPALHDVGPHGLHLGPSGIDDTANVYGGAPLVSDGGHSVWRSSSAVTPGWIGPPTGVLQGAFAGDAEWTIDFWWLYPDTPVTGVCFFNYESPAGSEAEAHNVLAEVGCTTSYAPVVGWEHGSGTNATDTGNAAMLDTTTRYDRHHFAWVKRSIGGGESEVDVYVDGELHETLGPLTDATGGTLSEIHLGVGQFTSRIFGYLDNVRISGVARSAEWIAAQYEIGAEPSGAPDPGDETPPVVSNVSPAVLTNIEPTTEVSFDVTDETGLVCVMVYVLYPDLGDAELVHDGATYMPRFISLSTRSPIAGGFRYTLRRSGGWKLAPGVSQPNIDIRIRALDAAGNEAT